MIEFEIPIRCPTLNVWQRWHWARRKKLASDVAWAMRAAIPANQYPDRPLKQCLIDIQRESTRAPDVDNLYGSCKAILDALQPPSKRHPLGLGIIADDSPRCLLKLTVGHLAGKGQRTIIRIEEP